MLLFSPDPSQADIKHFMDDDQRVYWDRRQGTPEERAVLWRSLEDLWRSIPDPTEAELEQVMGSDWGHVQRGENRDQILTFYRQKWKKDRKPEAVQRRDAQAEQEPELPKSDPTPEPPATTESERPTLPADNRSEWERELEAVLSSESPPETVLEATRSTLRNEAERLWYAGDVDGAKRIAQLAESMAQPDSETVTTGWRRRFESTKSFFKHLNGILRVLALGLAVGSLTWSWQVLGADEYGVALGLVVLFVVFSLVSLYGWEGVPQYPKTTKGIKSFLIIGIGVIAVYSAAVIWQKKSEKPWTTLWVRAVLPNSSPTPSDVPKGGYIQVLGHELLPPGAIGPNPHINLIYQAKGDQVITDLGLHVLLFELPRIIEFKQLEVYLAEARKGKFQKGTPTELIPESPIKFSTYPPMTDNSALLEMFPRVVGGKSVLYSIVVFQYRYKGMPEGSVRVTESCAWFSGNIKTSAWHDCLHRVYDIPQQ